MSYIPDTFFSHAQPFVTAVDETHGRSSDVHFHHRTRCCLPHLFVVGNSKFKNELPSERSHTGLKPKASLDEELKGTFDILERKKTYAYA